MISSPALRLFLRATIPQLRLTAVQRALAPGEESVLRLGARVAWAAGLAEFEQVEVSNFTRGQRCAAHIRFGREGEVEVMSSAGPLMKVGDALKVSAYAWLKDAAVENHEATFVTLDEGNAVIEFRRVPARMATLDPAWFPPPPAIEIVNAVMSLRPVAEAMD